MLAFLLPFGRRNLTLVGVFTKLVHHLCVDNVEDKLRIDVTAGRAFANIGVQLAIDFLEISDGVNRVTIIYKVSAGVQNHHLIEHLVDFRRWLVDNHKHEFALHCKLAEQVHYVF